MECAVKSNVHSTLQVYNPIMMGLQHYALLLHLLKL